MKRYAFVLLPLLAFFFVSASEMKNISGSHPPEKPAFRINLPPLLVFEPDNPVTGRKNRLRILGPLFESRKNAGGGSMAAFRPLWSMETKSDGRSAADVLWPLSMYRKTRSGAYFWFLPYFTTRGRNDAYEHYLFPFWFLERHADGQYSWFFFPLGGDMRKFFSYDRLQFLLFPLYKYGEKKHAVTNTFFWPFFSTDRAPGMHSLRIFPFYASRTFEGIRENRSILWPLANYAYSLKNPDDFAFFSFPLGGYEKWNGLASVTVLPPVFSWKEYQNRRKALSVLWPFFKYGAAEDGTGSCLYFWPFWGKAVSDRAYYSFFLWPAGLNLQTETETQRTVRRAFLPFYLSSRQYGTAEQAVISDYTHLWPLVSRHADRNETETTGLDFIPMKRLGFAERNYAAFWRFFEVIRNEKGFAFDLLWGLSRGYRTENADGFSIGPFYAQDHSAAGESEYDILFGLLHFRNQPENTCVRLFYCLEFSL